LSRKDAIISLLSSPNVTQDAALLLDPSTPQGQAFVWIVSDDEAQVDPCSSSSSGGSSSSGSNSSNMDPTERYTMAVFYYATNDGSWTRSDNWLSSASVCDWYGITCNSNSSSSIQHVTEIRLPNNNVTGSLPPELGALREMSYFDVFLNKLNGVIPVASLQQWTSLIMFNIENNTLAGGTAFDLLHTMHKIESFRTSFNYLTGTVPEYVFERPLSNLQQFWAAGNQLIGTIPSTLSLATNLGKNG
jgi:hypothetical protein